MGQDMVTSRTRDDRGVSAIEFSVVVPIVLLLIFLTIQAGFWMYGRSTALSAAREGVSYLRLAGEHDNPTSFIAPAEDYAYKYATNIGDLEDVEVDSEIDIDTGRVTMTVSGSMDAPAGTWTVTQSVSATLEKFRPDAEFGDGS